MNAVKIGNNHVCISPLKGVVQVVDPSQNIAGVTICTSCIAVGKGTVNVVAGAVAPTSVSDISKPIIFSANGNAASGHGYEAFMPYPLFLPAGQGLWLVGEPTGISGVSVTWDLLV